MTKYALLIGVSQYGPGLEPVPSAVKDVESMQRVLASPEMGNFPPENIKILKEPNKADMEEAIFWLFNNRQKDDLLLFYFSGHGVKDERRRLHLACHYASIEDNKLHEPRALMSATLHDLMSRSRSQRQVVILDCCFSGAFPEGMVTKDDGLVHLEEQLGGKGRAILTSSSAIEYSFSKGDGFGNSVYTHYLVEGIETGSADLDEDGYISAAELHEYASGQVKKVVPSMTPEFYPGEEGYKIYLSNSPMNDPKLKYRKELQERVERGQGKLSIFARKLLEKKQVEWKISAEEAKAIENEVLQPYQAYERRVEEYRQALLEAVEMEFPFSNQTSKDLQEYKQLLSLKHPDIVEVESQVLRPKQIEYEKRKEEALTRNNFGLALWKQRKVDEAIVAYQQAIELDPNTAVYHSNLGLAYEFKGDLIEAISEYRNAVRLAPNSSLAHNDLGLALYKQKNLREAADEYRVAIDLDPQKTVYHSNLALALEEMEKYDEAIEVYRKVVELAPTDILNRTYLGNVLLKQSKIEEAIAEYREAIRMDPESGIAHAFLGKALEANNQPDEAIVELQRAVQLQPDNALAHNYLGVVLYRQNAIEEAIAEYQKAIELEPNVSVFYSNLGLALESQNKWDEAEEQHRKAIQLDTESEELYKAPQPSKTSYKVPQPSTMPSGMNQISLTQEPFSPLRNDLEAEVIDEM